MLWVEMSRDETHGGGIWAFGKSLWSPARNRGGHRWAFWENLLHVKQGDQILHLRGGGKRAAFVGYSIAGLDGYQTADRPPEPGPWSYASTFYRVPLDDYVELDTPIMLRDVFVNNEAALREYYGRNSNRSSTEKLSLFYVIQNDALQCLNGGYLSQMDKELQNIVFNGAYPDRFEQEPFKSVRTVTVGEVVQLVNSRIGQADFSANVRGNYNNRCCFPGCIVADSSFLVGSHIARWADVPELRGEVSNGLCLCLMHDKAFESGYFTISENYTVVVNRLKAEESEWVLANIAPYDGQSIRLGAVLPSDDALLHHWIRTGFYE